MKLLYFIPGVRLQLAKSFFFLQYKLAILTGNNDFNPTT